MRSEAKKDNNSGSARAAAADCIQGSATERYEDNSFQNVAFGGGCRNGLRRRRIGLLLRGGDSRALESQDQNAQSDATAASGREEDRCNSTHGNAIIQLVDVVEEGELDSQVSGFCRSYSGKSNASRRKRISRKSAADKSTVSQLTDRRRVRSR